MAFERIELNICPAGDMPVFHCSQYDTGRPIIIDLLNGDDAFTPSAGTTFELHCRKVDDNIVTLDTYEVDGNTLTFNSTEQLCACPGDNLCEVAIYLDESCMGTLNFMLHVEADPLAGGLESETQIYNLTEQVEEITEQVIGDNYYDKTEVDDLLDTKADAATTYTKTEVDTALNLKADKSDTYTKTETNNLLAGKADASDTYSKTQVDNALALKANSADLATVATTGDYDDLLNKPMIPAAQVQSDYAQTDNTQVDYIKNKPDIEGMIADAILEVMPVDIATGAIATFNTELATPLVNVSCNVVATGGDGTPDNPILIVGYSSANITRCGVNLWDEEWELGVIAPDGTIDSNPNFANRRTTSFITVPDNSTVYMACPNNALRGRYAFYDSAKNLIYYNNDGPITNSISTPSGAKYMRITLGVNYGTTYNNDISINYPSSDHDYHSYNGQTYTVAFGQTVYGGVLDVTRGKLTVTRISYTFDGSESFITIDNNKYLYNFGQLVQSSYNNYSSTMCSHFKVGNYGGWANVQPNDYIVAGDYYIGVNPVMTLSDYKAWLAEQANNGTPVVAVATLVTPFDIDLTPVQIRALVGENKVYSDTHGNTTVQFKDSIQHYIDTRS